MDQVRIAVMNSSKEITEILQEAFEDEGFFVCTIFTYLLKERKARFDRFIKENKPEAIVYDIAIPYKENYKLFTELSGRAITKNTAFVLTTTNKDALNSLVGQTDAIEIIGKPFDLDLLIKAVRDSIARKTSQK